MTSPIKGSTVQEDLTAMVLIEEVLRGLPLDLAAFYRKHSSGFQSTSAKTPDRTGVYLVVVYPSDRNLQKSIHAGFAFWSSTLRLWSYIDSWAEWYGMTEAQLVSTFSPGPYFEEVHWSGFEASAKPDQFGTYI